MSSKMGKGGKGIGHQAVAADGLVALLTLARDSTDGFAVAKGVLGGLLWIVETSRQFKSNKSDWDELASYVLALRDDVEIALVEYTDRPPPMTLVLDVRKLHEPLRRITEEMTEMAKRSGFSKLLQAREDPKKIAGFRQSMTAAILRFNVVRLVSIERKLDTLIAPPEDGYNSKQSSTQKQNTAPLHNDDVPSFNLRITEDMWPEFNPGEGSLEAGGKFFFDFTDSWQRRWANGEETGGQFGRSIFPMPRAPPRAELPVRLFDLWTNRVVVTSLIDGTVEGYTIISHVWGEDLKELDGSIYGVDWGIPLRRTAKLDQILKAARIMGGLRYVWIDVLCLDQRPNEMRMAEISKMRVYYANATGCLVWLENTYSGYDWPKVLAAMEEFNRRFSMDKSGVPTMSVSDMMDNGFMNMSLDGQQAFELVQRILSLEKAPWFQRVWTLQEAVIPDTIYLCTPERYVLSGAALFHLLGLCGMVAKAFTDVGSMIGVAITHELQKSEVWKILRMRQIWRKGQVGYWHLVQAIRSRKSKYEQDRVFGVLGLLWSGEAPIADYKRDVGDLYHELWTGAIAQNQFGALCFLGDGHKSGMPSKACMGLISPFASEDTTVAEIHKLSAHPHGIQLEDVGFDVVKAVHAIVTNGNLRSWQHPAFLDLTLAQHVDIAKAYQLPPDTIGGTLCPAAFAAISSLNPLPAEVLASFGNEFGEKYELAIPKGLLMWVRTGILVKCAEDNAIVVIWTASSEPQLAVVTEKVEGRVVVITPSSYVDQPGEGCIICQITLNGELRKIGLGLGCKVKATQRMSALLV